MYTQSDNVEILIGTKTDNIIKELFKCFFKKYQEGLETKMKGNEFVFDNSDLLYYRLLNISLNTGGSYTDSPKWLKNKGATINPKIKDNECFKYSITIALNHEKIEIKPQRI